MKEKRRRACVCDLLRAAGWPSCSQGRQAAAPGQSNARGMAPMVGLDGGGVDGKGGGR